MIGFAMRRWRRSILPVDKHHFVAISAAIDGWRRQNRARAIEGLSVLSDDSRICRYLSASSLPGLALIAVRYFQDQSLDVGIGRSSLRRLRTNPLSRIRVLINRGYEKSDPFARAGYIEHTQIAASGCCLTGSEAWIVPPEAHLDALSEFSVPTHELALESQLHHEHSPTGELSLIDLAAKRRAMRPWIEHHIEAVLRHGQNAEGPEPGTLGGKVADYSSVRHLIAVVSGIEALLISLMAPGGKPFAEVSVVLVASAKVLVQLGAKPVLSAIELDAWSMEATKAVNGITPITKSITSVILYGQPPNMDFINAIRAEQDLAVIGDSAQSLGVGCNTKKICNFSTVACTRFFPSRWLGCQDDGGAILAIDDQAGRMSHRLRMHSQGKRYPHAVIGVRDGVDTLQHSAVMTTLECFLRQSREGMGTGQGCNGFMGRTTVARLLEQADTSDVFAQCPVLFYNGEPTPQRFHRAGSTTRVLHRFLLSQRPVSRELSCPDCTAGSTRRGPRPMRARLWAGPSMVFQARFVQALGAAPPTANCRSCAMRRSSKKQEARHAAAGGRKYSALSGEPRCKLTLQRPSGSASISYEHLSVGPIAPVRISLPWPVGATAWLEASSRPVQSAGKGRWQAMLACCPSRKRWCASESRAKTIPGSDVAC